jgi:hypothetical protein
MLQRSSRAYDDRRWPVPRQSGHPADQSCVIGETIPPQWPAEYTNGHSDFNYDYLCVDGGVMNNEPFDLARRHMAGFGASNPRGAETVERSLLMIDPFPGTPPLSRKKVAELPSYDVLQTLSRLATALKMQARFKADELALAQNSDVYSRFLIAPVRYTQRNGTETRALYPMASGVFGGFGGFFSERFRMHDFQLGRRNAQQFLRRHFVLPLAKAKQNPLFHRGDPSALDAHALTVSTDGGPKSVYPILPLVGSAKDEVFPLRWKTLRLTDDDLRALRRRITHRTTAVTNRLIDTQVDGGLWRTLAKLALRIKRDSVVQQVLDRVEADLDEYALR